MHLYYAPFVLNLHPIDNWYTSGFTLALGFALVWPNGPGLCPNRHRPHTNL